MIPSVWLADIEGVLVPATKGSSKAALLWREAREPLAHGLLMMGVGYSLMRLCLLVLPFPRLRVVLENVMQL